MKTRNPDQAGDKLTKWRLWSSWAPRAIAVVLGFVGWHGIEADGADWPQGAADPEGVQCAGLSPTALAATADGSQLFIACATANQVLVLDIPSKKIVGRIEIPRPALGLTLSKDDARLYAVCASPRSLMVVVDVTRGKVIGTTAGGHTALSPVLSPDGQTLYVCNRFDHNLSFLDVERGGSSRRVDVEREPVAMALTPDGQYLLVASHLPAGRANRATAASTVTVVDAACGTVLQEIALRPGSGLVRGISISPEGRYAAVAHILAHYHWLPRMAYLGWINQNVISLIDLSSRRLFATVPLDEEGRGAANPWAVAWSRDGRELYVSHTGTHELSIIQASALLDRLRALPERLGKPLPARRREWEYYRFPRFGPARARFDLPSDFRILEGIRERIQLSGVGPRSMAVVAGQVYLAHYFSDTVDVVDLRGSEHRVTSIALSEPRAASTGREGERWFNDASLCVQGWQSCASCHDADARADGFNWDLLNDGAHNPKNTRSLLFSASTPPMMALGVRDSARTAVRAGLRHILFGEPPSEVPEAIDRFLESLRPVPSPRLVGGQMTGAAERGRALFERTDVGCARCHLPPLFTDLRAYDVGTAGDYDSATDRFDTPSLIESWRTAPYLHDGSAATLLDVLTSKNAADRHGRTSHLTSAEIDDLAEFVLSL